MVLRKYPPLNRIIIPEDIIHETCNVEFYMITDLCPFEHLYNIGWP